MVVLLSCNSRELFLAPPQKYFDSINIDEFINQAKEFDSYYYDSLDKMAKVMSTMWQSHPRTVMRAAELFKWADSGQYDDVLNRRNRSNTSTMNQSIRYCSECGNKIFEGEKFCRNCGKKYYSAKNKVWNHSSVISLIKRLTLLLLSVSLLPS
jgi:hypothetical protein